MSVTIISNQKMGPNDQKNGIVLDLHGLHGMQKKKRN
jgi:hypothetical protein